MNDFFKNIHPDTLMRAKNTVERMLTEQQKQKLLQQFGNMSKEELMQRMNQLSGSRDLEEVLKNLDRETLLKKLQELE